MHILSYVAILMCCAATTWSLSCVECRTDYYPGGRTHDNEPDCASNDPQVLKKFIRICTHPNARACGIMLPPKGHPNQNVQRYCNKGTGYDHEVAINGCWTRNRDFFVCYCTQDNCNTNITSDINPEDIEVRYPFAGPDEK